MNLGRNPSASAGDPRATCCKQRSFVVDIEKPASCSRMRLEAGPGALLESQELRGIDRKTNWPWNPPDSEDVTRCRSLRRSS